MSFTEIEAEELKDNPHFLFPGQYRVFFLFLLQNLKVLQIQIDQRNMPAYPQDSGNKKCLPGTFIDSKVPNRHCCLTISCS